MLLPYFILFGIVHLYLWIFCPFCLGREDWSQSGWSGVDFIVMLHCLGLLEVKVLNFNICWKFSVGQVDDCISCTVFVS